MLDEDPDNGDCPGAVDQDALKWTVKEGSPWIHHPGPF